jgi:hypothetical protein
MSNVVLIDFAPELALEPAANSAPRSASGRDAVSTRSARGFLIRLVACEAQLAECNAVWLREVGRRLDRDWMMAETCDRLARETEALREQLIVLAQRLVARWNWLERRRQVDASELLREPISRAVAELVELHEGHVSGPTPWAELAALRPIEQMLAGMVPLAIDLAGFGFEHGCASELENAELTDAARLFGAREQRASELTTLLDTLTAVDSRRSAIVKVAEEQAIAAFTKVLAECAHLGHQLGHRC